MDIYCENPYIPFSLSKNYMLKQHIFFKKIPFLTFTMAIALTNPGEILVYSRWRSHKHTTVAQLTCSADSESSYIASKHFDHFAVQKRKPILQLLVVCKQ